MVRSQALSVVREQLTTAASAKKCHSCGCFHQTVAALAELRETEEIREFFPTATSTFQPKRYDCLGCAICYPAIAANAFAEAFPDVGAQLDLCPTEEPDARAGWPPLPGDHRVVRYRGTVAVCTLNSSELVEELSRRSPEGLAIVGTMQTENLGIERIVRNVLSNPNIRHLVLCGEDTQQSIGHLPGQSMESLFAGGIDEHGRIRGARGKRPVLKNLTREQVAAFVRQVSLISLVGITDLEGIVKAVEGCASTNSLPFEEAAPATRTVETVTATESRRLIPDPAGYFVVYPDHREQKLVTEHYRNDGTLSVVLEGTSAAAVYSAIVTRELITRLDHAAYLGRELARAEHSLATGERYVQDRAAGELEPEVQPVATNPCGCGPNACGGTR